MKKTAFLSILLCLCMVASLVLVPAPQASAAVDTTKLDGVYEASFSGQVMYILTFNNGKLTVEDKNMGTLSGEYTYTVNEDGIPVVDGGKFLFSKNMGGFYTVQPDGFKFPLDMTKTAELGGTEETENVIKVTTTDTYAWVDEFTFTADKAGDYTFTVPAGLGVFNADKFDDPTTAANSAYIDFNLDSDGGEFTVTLAAGQTIRFYLNAAEKKEWTITWRMETPILTGSIEVSTTETYAWDDAFTFTAPEDADYTFTIPAGLGIADADKFDDPATASSAVFIDYQLDNDGGKVTITLKKGESFRFYVGAMIKGDWIIEWTTAKQDGPQLDGPVAVLGENVIGVTMADMMAQAVEYYFVVEAAGNYTFTSDTLIVRIFQDMMMVGTGSAYLQPGVYKLAILLGNVQRPGEYNLTITTDAVIGGDNVLVMGENTIEYGAECIFTGKEYTFEVTEEGTYRFEGLLATIKDANGMQLGRNEAPLAPGTYTITLYNIEEAAGTFTVTIILVTEELLEQEAIDNVIALIEAIGEVTAESQDAIQTARDFYNALDDEGKAKVTNLAVLEAAEEAYAALTNPGDEPGDEPGNDEPTTPPTTQPTTPPTTQPNGGNDGDDNNGSPVVIIVIVVVVAVVVVAVILFSKKKKA